MRSCECLRDDLCRRAASCANRGRAWVALQVASCRMPHPKSAALRGSSRDREASREADEASAPGGALLVSANRSLLLALRCRYSKQIRTARARDQRSQQPIRRQQPLVSFRDRRKICPALLAAPGLVPASPPTPPATPPATPAMPATHPATPATRPATPPATPPITRPATSPATTTATPASVTRPIPPARRHESFFANPASKPDWKPSSRRTSSMRPRRATLRARGLAPMRGSSWKRLPSCARQTSCGFSQFRQPLSTCGECIEWGAALLQDRRGPSPAGGAEPDGPKAGSLGPSLGILAGASEGALCSSPRKRCRRGERVGVGKN